MIALNFSHAALLYLWTLNRANVIHESRPASRERERGLEQCSFCLTSASRRSCHLSSTLLEPVP